MATPTRTVDVGIESQSTVSAVEIGLSRTRTDMQATRTSLRAVGRIDEGGFQASGQGLVGGEGLQLCKRPAVQMSEHPAPGPISDARQILKDDSLPVCFRLGHNLLGDTVVRVPDKSMLPSRDTAQHAPGCATAVGLETRSTR